ncbi:MAG: HIT domain-containing protein [Candidatus Colwellbacteria bacterium]|jgi:diadenosine tetraphosphate (Ap4A) HIT family hydrolase|nr:HIT domain-containing protein [Candidatus Colwellbacteria bacterium]MDD3752813.1 HIT domain-containing protein [Candidatus Colwellbacteria bacterium]
MYADLNKNKSFCNTGNARNSEQLGVMKSINKNGYCPFCPENFTKNHKKPIIFDGKHWFVTENQWPYSAAKYHFLAITKNHIENLTELPKGAGNELIDICRYIEDKYGINSGAICMRFGDIELNGATVNHLHAHLLVPDPENKDPLYFWIDKKKPSSV